MAFTKITAAGIDTSGTVTTESISVSGVSTVGSLSIGNTSVISSGRQLQNIASLDATTTATIESAITNAPNTFSDLSVSGISTLGVTSATNLTSQQLNVSGISTFTNGPVLVGTATSTGTASQRLQVTGGGYFSSNVGIGTTNPTSKLHVVGDGLFTGVVTATSFSGSGANLTGIAVTENVRTNSLVVSGVSTFTTLRVGTAVTISGGIVTATSFYGDGTNLTNTGSTLSAASGSQRVVLTGQTSGTMTASATSSNLTFNGSTGALSATSFSGNLNSTGISTIHTINHPGQSNPLIVSRATEYVIHISDSGNDTTGNGSSGSPYRSLSKAFSMMPDILNKQSVYIKILGGTYTTSGSIDFYGLSGNGAVYSGQTITIGADSATTFNANHSMSFTDVSYPIQFYNLNYVTTAGSGTYGIFMYRCKFLYMKSDCTWTTSSTHGWSYGGGGYFSDTTVDWRANVTATSSASSGLGGLFVFDRCKTVNFSGNVTKSGTKFGNTCISVVNGTFFESSADITNFDTGLYNGANHYGAETGGYSMLNGFAAINCTNGIVLRNGANNRAYSVSYSGNTTNISSTNSWST